MKALIPLVIQILNTKECFLRINRSICRWPEALQDYQAEGVLDQMNSTEFDKLMAIMDPLKYKKRFEKLPKFLINAMGDEFMWPGMFNARIIALFSQIFPY